MVLAVFNFNKSRDIALVTETGNIFANIPDHLAEELIQKLVDGKHIKIERIVSHGHTTPEGTWYDQAWGEWVILLRGQAALRYEDGVMLSLKEGDFTHIPAHCRHRVEWTSPDVDTIWLAIHFD